MSQNIYRIWQHADLLTPVNVQVQESIAVDALQVCMSQFLFTICYVLSFITLLATDLMLRHFIHPTNTVHAHLTL